MSELIDNHGRRINYLRLAVTDRCNLRCFYCMPKSGIDFLARDQLLSYEEILKLIRILTNLGIKKVRFTGGEPFVRKDFFYFLTTLRKQNPLLDLHITTNGTHLMPFIDGLKKLEVKSVNLSLDSLDPKRFLAITRKDLLVRVLNSLEAILAVGLKLKINMVVMRNYNVEDVIPMSQIACESPVSVRFIEEMPFNGAGTKSDYQPVHYSEMIDILSHHYPTMEDIPNSKELTALQYRVPGWKGDFGVIAAYSRTFCGTCNRLRITPVGQVKTCLYDDGVYSIRDLIRAGATDQQIGTSVINAISHRHKDGFVAEAHRHKYNPIHESMSTIGG